VQTVDDYPHITIETPTAISTRSRSTRSKGARNLISIKSGTSKAIAASSQINEPDYGHLLDYMKIPDGAQVQHGPTYCLPRVRSSSPSSRQAAQGPGLGLLDVLRATE